MIELKKLSVSLKNEKILHNINLIIPEKKTTVIAGKSGSGKSVLIKTIEGIITPVQGTVIIDGIDIFKLNNKKLYQLRQKMSLLFQSSALFDSMNIYQNIAFPLVEHSNYTNKEIDFLIEQKLRLVDLSETQDKMPSDLSGGMKKRAALARAIINNPKYIFYDEPTTGLDPKVSNEIIDLIISIKKELNHTVVVITHDLNCLRKTADYIVFLEKGKVMFTGDYHSFINCKDPACKQFLE